MLLMNPKTETASAPDHERYEANHVRIVRTREELVVGMTRQPRGEPLRVTIEFQGRPYYEEWFNPCQAFRSGFDVDLLRCAIRVYAQSGELLVEAPAPVGDVPPLPYMVRRGEQVHETESSVSVPPALHITDERGEVWTLGLETKPAHLSPKGEFAFAVLRDGQDTGEIASRIEMWNGTIRIFTHRGWKRLSRSGREFV